MVSMGNAMDWMKRPTKLDELNAFGPWKCAEMARREQPCEVADYPTIN
jgi:hypothetical protein